MKPCDEVTPQQRMYLSAFDEYLKAWAKDDTDRMHGARFLMTTLLSGIGERKP